MKMFQMGRLKSCLGCITLDKACRFIAISMITLNILLAGSYLLVCRYLYPDVDQTSQVIRILIFTSLYIPSNVYLYLAAHYRKLSYFRLWLIFVVTILVAYTIETFRAYTSAILEGTNNITLITVNFVFILILGYILFVVYSYYLELQELEILKVRSTKLTQPTFTLKLAPAPCYKEVQLDGEMEPLSGMYVEKSAKFLESLPQYDEADYVKAEPPPPYSEC